MQKSAPNWLSENTRGEVGSQGAECRWKFRGRELNPGILRDRRKYEPLYYCGLASASVLILHGPFGSQLSLNILQANVCDAVLRKLSLEISRQNEIGNEDVSSRVAMLFATHCATTRK